MKSTNSLATIVAGLTLLCLWLPVNAQHPCQDEVTQNSLWSLPNIFMQIPEGNPPQINNLPSHISPPVAFSDFYYTGESATNAHNAIHDQNGNLKFFIVDQFLYNGNGHTIGRLSSNVGDDPSTSNIKGNSEICIVPDPADCERYYIFTSTLGSDGGKTGYFTHLDISMYNLDNSLTVGEDVEGVLIGGVGTFENNCVSVVEELNFLNGDGSEASEKGHVNYHFAASPLRESTNSRIVLMTRGNELFRILVDDTGIHPMNPVLSLGGNSTTLRTELEMKFIESAGKYRVAVGNINGVFTFEMDITGDIIPNSQYFIDLDDPYTSQTAYVKGLEFSESGQFLYFTHHRTAYFDKAVRFHDFSTMQTSVLQVPDDGEDFEYSQIELGADGKLYFAWSGGLAALSDPDNPNANNFELYAIPIPGYPLSDTGYPSQEAQLVYLLPDQIDGMNYYDHFLVYEDEECCLHHPPYDATSYTASSSATWAPGSNPFSADPNCDVVLIQEELRIPDGVTITIEDMRFEFLETARVTVETGGKLIMKNTTFTYGPCGNKMWHGVEVWGDPDLSQYPESNQGVLIMQNNSVIEHAWIGALAGTRSLASPPLGFGVTFSTGGIIRAFDSQFRNNQRDVMIHHYIGTNPAGYTADNRSNFYRCDFLTDGPLNHTEEYPYAHVDLSNVRGVKFTHCSFRNTASFADHAITKRGRGIFSNGSTFKVIGKNEPFVSEEEDHQTFYKLYVGIEAIGADNHPFTASKMEFQKNKVGIVVEGACFETITFNNFDIPEVSTEYPGSNWGAYLMNSHSFTIEENNFVGGPELTKIAGLGIENSNPGFIPVDNEVYRNFFAKLEQGIVVFKNNRSAAGNYGLQTRCNKFSVNRHADIYLTAESEWRDDQGSAAEVELLTNNSFSYNNVSCSGPYKDVRVHEDYGILSSTNLMFDYWCLPVSGGPNNGFTVPDFDYLHPTCPEPHLENAHHPNHSTIAFDYEEHCPSNFTPIGGGKYEMAELLPALGLAESNLSAAEAVYRATVDGGDTEDIIDLLENILNEESAYLRDLLMARHPLSKAALLAAIDAAEAFDPWHLTQVLVANSPLPGEVFHVLKYGDGVLSPFFMQFVDNAQQNSSASLERLLNAEIAYRQYEKSTIERDIQRYYLYHADSLDAEGWMSFVESREEDSYKFYLLGEHLDKGETGQAQSILDSLGLNNERKDWIQFMINQTAADTITSADYATAWNFFYNSPTNIGNAWGWLTAHGQLDSVPPVPEILTRRSMSLFNGEDEAKAERWLEAWPNPAKDHVVLTYPREADGIGTVQIFGPKGEFIRELAAGDVGFEEININGWSPGLYIAKLLVNGETFDTVKISVVK